MSADVEIWEGRQVLFELMDGPIIPMVVFAPYIEDEVEATQRFLRISELHMRAVFQHIYRGGEEFDGRG